VVNTRRRVDCTRATVAPTTCAQSLHAPHQHCTPTHQPPACSRHVPSWSHRQRACGRCAAVLITHVARAPADMLPHQPHAPSTHGTLAVLLTTRTPAARYTNCTCPPTVHCPRGRQCCNATIQPMPVPQHVPTLLCITKRHRAGVPLRLRASSARIGNPLPSSSMCSGLAAAIPCIHVLPSQANSSTANRSGQWFTARYLDNGALIRQAPAPLRSLRNTHLVTCNGYSNQLLAQMCTIFGQLPKSKVLPHLHCTLPHHLHACGTLDLHARRKIHIMPSPRSIHGSFSACGSSGFICTSRA
jgi:hypothetical protein